MVSTLSEDWAKFPIIGLDLSEYSPNLPHIQPLRSGNLTEGLTVFELKDGNLIRRVGIGVCHRRLAAPDAASSIDIL